MELNEFKIINLMLITFSSISISANLRNCLSFIASASCVSSCCLLMIKLTTFKSSGAAAIELAYNLQWKIPQKNKNKIANLG